MDLSVTYTVNNNGLRKIKPLSDALTLSERLRSREQLRSGNKQSATIFLPFTRLLLSALNKLPDVKGLTVYHGINAKLPEVVVKTMTYYYDLGVRDGEKWVREAGHKQPNTAGPEFEGGNIHQYR